MQFDPSQYLDVETTEALVRRPPLPVGDYMAVVGTPETKAWSKEDKSGIRVMVPLAIGVPPDIRAQLAIKQDTITLTDSLFLDVTAEGMIDWSPGMNRQLRRYREALDMNKAGEAFSIRRLAGRPIKVRLEHDMYQGEVQERIGGVVKP